MYRQAGEESLGRALGWMDQYLEDTINKVYLIINAGPKGNSEVCFNSEFCFRRIAMFPETKLSETLGFEGNKIHCSLREQSLSD